MQAPAALRTRPWKGFPPGPGAAIVLGAAALGTPFPFLFACACTCGGAPPADAPEAPWQPALLIAGGVLAVLTLRRRGGGGTRPGGTNGGHVPRRGLARRVRSAAVRLAAALAVTCVTLTAASFAGAATAVAKPVVAPDPTAPACDCALPSRSPASGVRAATVAVPEVGADPRLPLALALTGAGGAVALAAPARRRAVELGEVPPWTG